MVRGDDSTSSLFLRLRNGLARTHDGFTNRIERLVLRRNRIDEDLIESLEELYIQSDVGPGTTFELMEGLREAVAGRKVGSPQEVLAFLRQQAGEILAGRAGSLRLPVEGPAVILVVGTNGSGKTTTVAKLGHRLRRDGRRVLLAAADTFRAAASEQLEAWGTRAGLEVISQKPGADPAAVLFDTIRAAQARDYDVVIADTAGRLHTKVNLMEELKKISRTASRLIAGAPHETLLVLDATTGQNAMAQVRLFDEALGLSGMVLAKLDGTAKGGFIIGLAREHEIPVKLIGVGETLEDLQDFVPGRFIKALFGDF